MPRALQPPFSVTMDSASALRQRPTLAAAIGVITAIWANIEHELGLIMATILGAEPALGIAIYLNLRSEEPRREVLKTAAKTRLSAERAEEIVRIVCSLRDRAKGRNDIVHDLWGISDEHPEHLVWLDRRESLQARSQDKKWVGTNITVKSSQIEAMTNKPAFHLYGEQDFADMQSQLEECLKDALWIHALLLQN